MRRRTFEEMITYFNQTVSEMDIDRKYKMTLLGMVTALLQRHDEDVAQIVRCKDCNHWSRESICDGFCSEDCMRHDEDFFCGYAEKRTDEEEVNRRTANETRT